MPANDRNDAGLLLPEGARLLHIGLMKTGTTSLQNAASALRPELLSQGVRYPGEGLNHRTALLSLMGRGWGWGTSPSPEAWARLQAEIQAESSRRLWLGHELLSEADGDQVRRFREVLGGNTHVVVTLRSYGSILPSAWQQMMKGGRVQTFDAWLRAILADSPKQPRARLEAGRLDQGAVVSRWAEVFGPQNVTVVVVDKSTPTLLFDAFESMLGLESGLLSTAEIDGAAANRGMSAEEAELLRTLNATLRQELSWSEYLTWVRASVASTMLGGRGIGSHDTAIVLPAWAAEIAETRAAKHVGRIRESGVRVVGDLDLLQAPVKTCDTTPPSPTSIPLDAAAQAVLGAIAQGRAEAERAEYYRERLGAWGESGRTYGPRLGKASGRELAGALARRVRDRLTGRLAAPGPDEGGDLAATDAQAPSSNRGSVDSA
ncbi:hypothetical protein ACNHYB_15100 [Isoptericola jiangsuensis]|uniref:hypothetical protein n=1 Tax=Isoptericola jiangsuensis TaxID=548579 RepID=UPI003AAA433D